MIDGAGGTRGASGFFDMIGGVIERGRAMIDLGRADQRDRVGGLLDLCGRLLGAIGEASGTAVAAEVLRRYDALTANERHQFLQALGEGFAPNPDALREAIRRYEREPSPEASSALHFASEPPRQTLLRRLNLAPGGTAALVAMREDLLSHLPPRSPGTPALRALDADFRHLFTSWFNRGFLEMRRIDWQTPAAVLERIIRYEAVHAIYDWDDLRRRIDPPDRRLYAFFHPALPGEPLIFVEVALTVEQPGAIGPILSAEREPLDTARARVAAFYSISNCQRGLRGISFGSFLIKQVAADLTTELPVLSTFVTLSPMPDFAAWARGEGASLLEPPLADMIEALPPEPSAAQVQDARLAIEPLAHAYLTRAKNRRDRPLDPVARFHLGNGARLERLNWMGNPSASGLRSSFGMMVNYLYALDAIERNHEAYANEAAVIMAPSLRRAPRGVRRDPKRGRGGEREATGGRARPSGDRSETA